MATKGSVPVHRYGSACGVREKKEMALDRKDESTHTTADMRIATCSGSSGLWGNKTHG